jgi:hypothetical protein
MKKSLHVVLALSIGVLIGVAGTAFAAGEVVQAVFAKFNYVVNGDPVEIEAEALVYQDSTYLPVRSIMNALGYDVTYMTDSRTIRADKSVPALLREVQKIGGDIGMVPVDEVTLEEIEFQIELVQGAIQSLELILPLAEKMGLTDEIEKTLEQIAIQQARLAELEAKKAELEAKLQQ